MSKKYIGDKLIKGSFWSVASRFTMRGLGFINTIVLARLLNPEDFGLIALAMLVVGLVTLFANTGMSQAILRRKEINDSLINTAWTMKILIGLTLSVIIFCIAPFAAQYFHDDRIDDLIRVMSLLPLFDSLMNIGFVLYAKELEYKKMFYRTFFSKFIAIIGGISVAFWLQNYWALAVGMVLKSFINLVMSYILHPYRPKICFHSFNELLPDSINTLSRTIAVFLASKVDEYFVGYLAGANSLGGYYMSKSVTNMLTVEIVQPMSQALLPGYSQMKGDIKRQRIALIKVIQTVALFSFGTSIGLLSISDTFISVVFGSKWENINELFMYFSLLSGINSLHSVTGPFLLARGKLKLLSSYCWFSLALLTVILWYLHDNMDLVLIVKGILLLNISTLFINYSFLIKLAKINIFTLAECLYKPCIAALTMFLSITYTKTYWLEGHTILNLVSYIVLGVLTYVLTIYLLWLLKRNKNTAEYILFCKVFKKY